MKLIVWLILCLIWGSTWLFIKVGLEGIPPFTFAAFRFILAIIVVVIVAFLLKIPLPNPKRDWKLLLLTGVLQFSINYSFVFWGELYISSGLAAVLQATIPIFGLFLAGYFLPNEKITYLKIGALLLGICGVGLIFIEQLRVNSLWAFWGSFGIVVGAFAAAAASILTKAKGDNIHPASLVLGQMFFGVVPIIFIALIKEGNPLNHSYTLATVGSIIFLSIFGTIIAFSLYYWLLSKIESTKAMTIALVTPLIAVVFGAIFLNEQLPPQTIWGGFLIMFSVVLLIVRRRIQNS